MTRFTLILVAATQLAACAFGGRGPRHPSANYNAPVVSSDRIEIVDAAGHYAPLVIDAPWQRRGDRVCVSDADISLVTPRGPMTLYRTSACATLRPFSLVGEANVPMPALGVLEGIGVESNRPRAKIAIGVGKGLGRIDIAGEPMALNPHQFYLDIRYFSGLEATVGRATFSTPAVGARLVVAPQEPMMYLAGSLTGVLDDAGFGFAASGRLPFSPRLALYDGRRWGKRTFTGHILAHGTVPLHPYPLSMNGRMLIDLDADDDGTTALEGDVADLAVAGYVTLLLGYDAAGFGFSVEIGEASLAYDEAAQTVSFAGRRGGGLFEGTPLAFIDAGSETTIRGQFSGPANYEVTASVRRSLLAGFSMSDTTVSLTPRGVRLRGTMSLAKMGSVLVEGAIDPRGRVALRGVADLTIGGFRMAAAEVRVSSQRVEVRGRVQLPGLGAASVAGTVAANGQFKLAGTASLSPAGLRLGSARVAIDTRGAAISGSVQFLGNRIAVSGRASASGRFHLAGRVSLNLLVVRGTLSLGLSNRGLQALIEGRVCAGPACVPVAGIEVDRRGRVCPIFPVVGKQCIQIAG